MKNNNNKKDNTYMKRFYAIDYFKQNGHYLVGTQSGDHADLVLKKFESFFEAFRYLENDVIKHYHFRAHIIDLDEGKIYKFIVESGWIYDHYVSTLKGDVILGLDEEDKVPYLYRFTKVINT